VSPDEGPVQNAERQPALHPALEICNEFVGLMKKYGGRGPTRCRAHLHLPDDIVIVVFRGGYTPAEQTLFEAGKFLDVRTARHSFQDAMEVRFVEVIERVTGREVLAFMAASHQDPDLQVETFVLKPEAAAEPSGPD
jgi:uncharacterized protein YbcI